MRARLLFGITSLVLLLTTLPMAIADTGGAVGADTGEIPDDQVEDNADPAARAACDDVRSPSGSLVIRRLVDGPRQDDGTPAFTTGVCIYLPPGYADGTVRYPVLFLLHGGFGYQHDWVSQGDLQATMDHLVADDPAAATIVVMPDAGYAGFWRDDVSGTPRNETYVIDHLVPWVDAHLRTIPTRDARGIAGLSNGGAGAARLAAKHPDLFGVMSAMSGAFPVATAAPGDVRGLADDPTHIADNLNDTPLALIWGSECGELGEPCARNSGAFGFEQVCCTQARFVDALDHAERRVPYELVETTGGHDWAYWSAWLREHHGPFILDRLADPQPTDAPIVVPAPPDGFNFRSIEPVVEVFDWTFTTEAGRATEFLRLAAVSDDAFTITGSGQVEVRTRPVYTPGERYLVAHATPSDPVHVVAADDGTLTFTVDLGPANVVDEAAAQSQHTAGVHPTVTRSVTIHRADGTSVDGRGTVEHLYLPGEQYHYFLYTPASYDPTTPTPMQLVIHGANTVAREQMLANQHHAVADREGFLVLYPDFVNTAERHPNSNESDQASGLGTHPIRLWDSMDVSSRARRSGDAANVVAMIDEVSRRRTVDADRVYVSGMSSGAMMTSLLMGLYPDVFAAGGIIAGCGFASIGSCPVATDPTANDALAAAAFAAMGVHARPVPFIEMHGQRDTTVQPSWGDAAVQQWLKTANLASGSTDLDGPIALTPAASTDGAVPGGYTYTVDTYVDGVGCPFAEHWRIHEMNHHWPGGSTDPAERQNFNDPLGPSGAEATWAFFSQFTLDGHVGGC